MQGAFYMELAEKPAKDKPFIFGWFSHRISYAENQGNGAIAK